MTKFKTTRVCSGEYTVQDSSGRFVRVCRVYYPHDGTYWIAAPDFDNNTSDPLPTKRDAVQTAHYMLETY